MLFSTVYGPELQAIHSYVVDCNIQGFQPEREDIQGAFIARQSDGNLPSTQSVDDALAFLESARMLEVGDGYRACTRADEGPFAVQLLQKMRSLEKGEAAPDHPVDPL